jgi:hypothetical protein
MAYDKYVAERIRQWVGRKRGFEEKAMFGGIGFLLNGNMCVGVWKDSIVLRVGKEVWQSCLEQDYVAEFDITGRSMTGWVLVGPDGFDTEVQLDEHLSVAVNFVRTLPPK